MEQGVMLVVSCAACAVLILLLTAVLAARRRDRTAFHELLARSRTEFDAMEKAYLDAPLGLAMLDRDLRYLRINRHLANINGLAIEAHIGKSVEEIVPDLAPQVRERFGEVLRTGKPLIGAVLAGKTGSQPGVERFWRENVYPILGPDGAVVGVTVTVEECTCEKRLNDALHDSERRERERAAELEALMDAVPAAIFMTRSPRCENVTGNREVTRILRMRPDERFSLASPGERPYKLRRHGRDCALDSLPLQMAAAGIPVRGDELEAHFENGDVVHILVNAAPLRDAAGELAGAVSSFVDITDQKRAASLLREDSLRKDEFIATLAHELRNPLAAIRTALDLMKISPPGAPAIAQTREIMDRQLHHLVRLIDDLLDVSRINCGKLELVKESATVAQVIESALQVSSPCIAAAGHTLELSMPPETCRVKVDRVRIEQVLTNLLTNAAKYTPPGGRIRVSASAEGRLAVIRIADNGIGIDPATLPTLFEVFTQAESGRAMRRGGIGIGLCLARRLVTLHGGSLAASSAGPGQGTTFTIRLPLCAAPQPARTPPPPVRPAAQDRDPSAVRRRILVVEDNPDLASAFAMLVTSCGHEVELVHTGASAIERAAVFRPELVFLDLGLPDIGGCEVAQAFRQDESMRGAVLVAVTGWGALNDREATRRAGFDMHLAKPVGIDAIRKVLADLPLARVAEPA
ncbi:hybrid sensor histidine kinase/response regulator [Massilia aerilata]|uniref:histidine kinase n=1 Tax=Massilia aerilata TaxID=453817 RepID=A0ABW0S356_9BURK